MFLFVFICVYLCSSVVKNIIFRFYKASSYLFVAKKKLAKPNAQRALIKNKILTLGELVTSASAFLSRLFTFFHTWVAGEKP